MKKRHMMDHVAPRAIWDTLICSVDDDAGDDDKGGGGDDDADAALKKVQDKLTKSVEAEKALRAKVREFEADKAAREADEAKKADDEARKKGEWDKIEEGHKKTIAEKEGEALLWRSRYEEKVISLELGSALDDVKVRPEMRKIVSAFLQNENVIELDENGAASIDGKPIAEFVQAWAGTDEGKAFIVNGSSGGDAHGSGKGDSGDDGDNPWMLGKVNLDKQGAIWKADPAKARALAAAAGAKIG